jgi:hypothetical protein
MAEQCKDRGVICYQLRGGKLHTISFFSIRSLSLCIYVHDILFRVPFLCLHPFQSPQHGFHTHTHQPLPPSTFFDLTLTQGGERSVMSGDGMAEQNLRENPGGPPRINERNLNVESEYEYGSRAGFWRLFRLFGEHGMKFTLYAVAQAVEQQPEVVKRCVEVGHDVASQ